MYIISHACVLLCRPLITRQHRLTLTSGNHCPFVCSYRNSTVQSSGSMLGVCSSFCLAGLQPIPALIPC